MLDSNITAQEFLVIRDYIHLISGIFLHPEKEYLVKQRLSSIFDKLAVKSFLELALAIQKGQINNSQKEWIITAITTNETFFFRDIHPFDALKSTILPQLYDESKRNGAVFPKIKIWSAAASTGQEAYSIAITIDEFLDENKLPKTQFHNFQIIATDIDNVSLEYAKLGIYNSLEISRGLSQQHKNKYFTKANDKWSINENLKKIIQFRKLSLHENLHLQNNLPTFDLIFARNVLIYFDDSTRFKIIQNLYKRLEKSGFLVLGSAESIYGLNLPFLSSTIGNSIFYKPTNY